MALLYKTAFRLAEVRNGGTIGAKMNEISYIIAQPPFEGMKPVFEQHLLNAGVTDFDMCHAELPGYTEADVLYVDGFPPEQHPIVADSLNKVVDVLDHDFDAHRYQDHSTMHVRPT